MSFTTYAAPQATEAVKTEVFAALPFAEKLTLSPDGDHMAGLFAVNGKQNIVISPILGSASSLMLFEVPDRNEVAWVRWVGNDNIIVGFYALRNIEGRNWYVSRLIGVNRIKRKVTQIFWDSGGQNASEVLWVANDGSPTILLSAQDSIYTNYPGFWPDIYRVNVETGGKTSIQSGRTNVLDWSADHRGWVRIGRSKDPSSGKASLLYRASREGAFRTVERANLMENEELNLPFLFRTDSDLALVISPGENGHRSILEMNLRTGDAARSIYDEKDVMGVILNNDRSQLLGARINSSEKDIHWFDPTMAAHQAYLEKASPASIVEILSFNQDLTKILVKFTTHDNPGLLYYYDASNEDLLRLAPLNQQLGGRRLSPLKLVQYKARDGLEIEAVLTLPRGRDSNNLPLIVMPHGGPWTHDWPRYDYVAQFLAARGYAVIQPNFRGSTGYGEAFEKAGEGQMGRAMQDDVSDAVLWAVGEGMADPKRVCIAGFSYGGYSAMWGIAKDPDFYRCAISINGVSNVRREVNDFGGSLYSRIYRGRWQRMSDDFDAISPIYAVAKIKTPLLLIHGKKDVTVDHIQSERMHKAMTTAGKSSKFISLPLADHYFMREADRLTMLKAMEGFLNQHNPAYPSP